MAWVSIPKGAKLAIASVVSIFAIIAIWHWIRAYDIRQEYNEVFSHPAEFPDWLVATGPEPRQTLSVRDANFGEASSNDPFWPGYGVICIQIQDPVFATDAEIYT